MKLKDEVLININGQIRRASVCKRHRDGTITIQGLSGSGVMLYRRIRVLSSDLVLATHPNVERAAKLDAERYGNQERKKG